MSLLNGLISAKKYEFFVESTNKSARYMGVRIKGMTVDLQTQVCRVQVCKRGGPDVCKIHLRNILCTGKGVLPLLWRRGFPQNYFLFIIFSLSSQLFCQNPLKQMNVLNFLNNILCNVLHIPLWTNASMMQTALSLEISAV